MMIETEIRNVRCISTCDTLSTIRGDACYLPLPKARMLEAMKAVKIVEDIRTPATKRDDTDYLFRSGFSKRKLTRVAWVQNYSKNGGAEISNFTAVNTGVDLGFDVVGVILETLSLEVLREADIIIVNNLHAANREMLFEFLYKTDKPWVKYDHDLCETEMGLYKKSRLNIFISPAHRVYYEQKCGSGISRSICLPLAFNIDNWKHSENGRVKDSVLVPSYQKCRTAVQTFIKDNPELRYYVAGNLRPIGLNITSLGDVPYDKMNDIYRQYETVLHVPNDSCAGERILFEAVLSGCQVITNENAGHTSWRFDWRNHQVLRPILQQAVYQFWREIEQVAYGS